MNWSEMIKWCNENQGFAIVLLTTMYVSLTATLAIVGFRANALGRRQLEQAVELEQSRTRPFVLLELVTQVPFVEAIVRNVGQTAARDVKFDLKPELKVLLGGKGMHPKEERELDVPFISQGIAILPPQREITALIGIWSRVESRYQSLHFEGTVSYSDTQGKSYSDPVILDLNPLKGLLHRGTKDIGDAVKQLEEISKTLQGLATGFNNPLVRTIAEHEFRKEQEESFEQASRELERMNGQQQKESEEGKA